MYVRTKPDSRHKPKEYRDLTLGIGRKDYNQLSEKKRERKMSVGELLAAGSGKERSIQSAPGADTPWPTILNTFQSWKM